MMWDAKIREAYGSLANPEGYFDFHLRMQWELEEAIYSYTEEFDCSDKDALKGMHGRLYVDGWKPITKILDEYNFQKCGAHSF